MSLVAREHDALALLGRERDAVRRVSILHGHVKHAVRKAGLHPNGRVHPTTDLEHGFVERERLVNIREEATRRGKPRFEKWVDLDGSVAGHVCHLFNLHKDLAAVAPFDRLPQVSERGDEQVGHLLGQIGFQVWAQKLVERLDGRDRRAAPALDDVVEPLIRLELGTVRCVLPLELRCVRLHALDALLGASNMVRCLVQLTRQVAKELAAYMVDRVADELADKESAAGEDEVVESRRQKQLSARVKVAEENVTEQEDAGRHTHRRWQHHQAELGAGDEQEQGTTQCAHSGINRVEGEEGCRVEPGLLVVLDAARLEGVPR
eukprot:scaffold235183_cov30-Tisochrysis_lutea.AAC.4